MTAAFDRDSREARWSQALREHGDVVAKRPPNARLIDVVGDLNPGVALDAGCGHGAETLWLAARGWHVTAVDFSATALAQTATPAAGQVQVSVDEAVAALDPARWEFAVAEDRPRAVAGTGVDAVICARRLF